MTANFTSDLKRGQIGQDIFKVKYPEYIGTVGYNRIDFNNPKTGESVELKSDSYDMNKTPNLFLEKYSNHKTRTLGGPFSAAEAEVTWFVYYFVKNDTAFWYKPEELVEWLNQWEGSADKNLIGVRNAGYVTLGLKTPRDLVQHLCHREESWK